MAASRGGGEAAAGGKRVDDNAPGPSASGGPMPGPLISYDARQLRPAYAAARARASEANLHRLLQGPNAAVIIGNLVTVPCQGLAAECSTALDCPCHQCMTDRGITAAVSLNSGRLCLLLPDGGDGPRFFRLSKSQGPVQSLTVFRWCDARVVVDPACLDDYVYVKFPSTPRPSRGLSTLASGARFTMNTEHHLYFDFPRGIGDEAGAEDADAELIAWAKAAVSKWEELFEGRLRQRAMAVLLGLHPRVGAFSPLKVLCADTVKPILRLVRSSSGIGVEAAGGRLVDPGAKTDGDWDWARQGPSNVLPKEAQDQGAEADGEWGWAAAQGPTDDLSNATPPMPVPPSRTIGWGTEHGLGGGPGRPPNWPYQSELPHYNVVCAYPDLQSPDAPAEPSSLAPLPSHDGYRDHWCVHRHATVMQSAASYDAVPGRGGLGPSPIDHKDLELFIVISKQLLNGTNGLGDNAQLHNPFWHPKIRHLRAAFLEFHAMFPQRAEAIKRQPRVASVPRGLDKRSETILEIWLPIEGLDGWFRNSVSLRGNFEANDIDYYTRLLPLSDAPRALLAQGEGQTVARRDLSRAVHFYALECRYMKGLDVTWDPNAAAEEGGSQVAVEAMTSQGPTHSASMSSYIEDRCERLRAQLNASFASSILCL